MDNECTSRVCAGSREVGRQHYIVLFGRAVYLLIVYLFNVNSDVMKMSAMSVIRFVGSYCVVRWGGNAGVIVKNKMIN